MWMDFIFRAPRATIRRTPHCTTLDNIAAISHDIDVKYNTGEALRMINTRRQSIKDECNEKTRRIVSHQEKETVAVRSVTYYG
jgi:hypothetical protein